MADYKVKVTTRRFDCTIGRTRFFADYLEVTAPNKEIAETNAWQLVLGEYPYCELISCYVVETTRYGRHD